MTEKTATDPRWATGEMDAAYAHVDALVPKADMTYIGAPLWHGWALREAFLAGAQWQRDKQAGAVPPAGGAPAGS